MKSTLPSDDIFAFKLAVDAETVKVETSVVPPTIPVKVAVPLGADTVKVWAPLIVLPKDTSPVVLVTTEAASKSTGVLAEKAIFPLAVTFAFRSAPPVEVLLMVSAPSTLFGSVFICNVPVPFEPSAKVTVVPLI